MHLTDLDEDFLNLLDNKPADSYPAAAVVGDISRTWFNDKTLMVDLFSVIQEHDPEFFITIHGAHGFDTCAQDAASCLGAGVESQADGVPWAERFNFRAHLAATLVGAAWMLLVMVRRNEKGSLFDRCWSVDPEVFELALELGLPIFAVTESGVVKAIP